MSKVLVLKHFHFFLFPCSLTFSFLKYEPNTSTYIHSANSSSLYKIPCKCHLLVKPSSILLGREHSPMFLQPSEHTQFLPLHPCLAPWSFYIIPFLSSQLPPFLSLPTLYWRHDLHLPQRKYKPPDMILLSSTSVSFHVQPWALTCLLVMCQPPAGWRQPSPLAEPSALLQKDRVSFIPHTHWFSLTLL